MNNMTRYIMGIDIGTTGSKATVFDEKGMIVAQAYREYPTKQYNGIIDPQLVWNSVSEVIRTCAEQQPVIEAICTTSFGETVVLLDGNQNVLCESILYTASGVEEEWEILQKKIGNKRLAEITGLVSHPMYTVNRMMWYRRKQGLLYEHTACFLFFSGFVNMKLCGICAAEDTQAARSLAYDVRRKCWSEEILRAADISREKLPFCVSAGEKLGRVSQDTATFLGLKNQPVVIAGGHDQPCVALGMGGIRGGTAVYGLGTVECLSLVMDDYWQTEEMRKNYFVCTPHVLPGKYLTYGVLYSGGNVMKDLRNQLYRKEYEAEKNGFGDTYKTMYEEIPEDTDVIFLPHIYGKGTPEMKLTSAGTVTGLRGETRRGEMVLAALQGLAFDMRENIKQMEKCGLSVNNICVAGGGAKSSVGLQVRANALNRSLYIPKDVQAGTKGVFLLAAKSLGWIKDLDTYIFDCADNGSCVNPDPEKAWQYEWKFRRYQKLKKMIEEFEYMDC